MPCDTVEITMLNMGMMFIKHPHTLELAVKELGGRMWETAEELIVQLDGVTLSINKKTKQAQVPEGSAAVVQALRQEYTMQVVKRETLSTPGFSFKRTGKTSFKISERSAF